VQTPVPETLLPPVPACLTGPVLVQIFLVPTAQPERQKWKYFHSSFAQENKKSLDHKINYDEFVEWFLKKSNSNLYFTIIEWYLYIHTLGS
jgi:hypothetical protein